MNLLRQHHLPLLRMVQGPLLFRAIILAITLVISLVASGCFSPVQTLPTPTPWPTPPLSEQQSYTVVRGTMVDQLRFNGQVVPESWVPLAFQVSGELATLLVAEGDAVTEGALLAELAMPEINDALAQAELTLEQAQDALRIHENRLNFDLKRAQLALQRAQLLLDNALRDGDPDVVALLEIDVELAELRVAEIEAGTDPTLERTVTKAQLDVAALERQAEEHRVRAPFAGQIVAIGVNLDNLRSLPERPQPRTPIPAYAPLIVIAEAAPLRIPLRIVVPGDAARATELTMGQPVTVTHPWAKDAPFPAEVIMLPRTLNRQGLDPTFPAAVHLAVPADHPPLAIGDYVDVTALVAVHRDTLLLPEAAIRRFAGRTFVVIQEGERQRRIDIQTGLERDGAVEILAGLNEDDKVLGR